MKNEGGVTLTELMIAVALIGIGILGAVSAFTGIHKGIQYSKTRTLASNIGQEKMQIIMQKPYYEVLVTTTPAFRTDFTPNIPYDPNYFKPETITEGGVTFTRLTNVEVAHENSGTIEILPPLTPDTGMRRITETVIWASASGNKSLSIVSVLNNPNTVMDSTWLKGTVTDASTSAGIPGAQVVAAENVGWRDTTDNTGKYSINLVPGTFNFQATAPGYYPLVLAQTVAPASVTTLPFPLVAIASGTIKGTAWLENHLVISQVVASTGPANGVEYVELYNPTTSDILIGTQAGMATPNITLAFWDPSNTGYVRQWHYTNPTSYALARRFYLVSNTGSGGSPATSCDPLTVAGVTLTPDACWGFVSAPNHAIECGAAGCSGPTIFDAGGVSLITSSGYTTIPGNVNMFNWPAAKIDSVGWAQSSAGNAAPSNAVEGTRILPVSGNGLDTGEQFIRKTDTTTVISPSLGRAYDADINITDFVDITPITISPLTSAITRPPATGTPATGARISVTDGLSATSSAILTGNPPYAQFTVPSVATGTWIVFVDSGSYSAEIDTVSVVTNSTTSIPNASTSPPWPATGISATVLSTNGIVGIISGKVTDITNTPISGGITVTLGGYSTTTGPSGAYAIRVPTGTYDVTANPNNTNSQFATQTQTNVAVTLGDATQNINFSLSQGGQISGWITRDGTNPLPGFGVVAINSFGGEGDTEVSGANGRFTLINLTTGTYTVSPVVDTKESSTPASSTITVNAGFNAWVGTFTITGAMGQVQGSVKAGGQPIKSGVLIVVSTGTVSSPPPTLSSNTLTTAAYYSGSSDETGTYSVDVRGSTTTYNVKAFYMRLANQTPIISTANVSNVTVSAGQPTTGINFTW